MYISRLHALLVQCNQNSVNNARLVGINALALVKKRVTQEGKDSSDSVIPGYSNKKVPKYYYKNKKARSGSAYSQLDDLVSYEDWREANNLATDKVTYFFTGEMWNSMKVAVLSSNNGVSRVLLGPSGEENIKKFAGLSASKGEFLTPTKSEMLILAKANRDKKINDFRRAGL